MQKHILVKYYTKNIRYTEVHYIFFTRKAFGKSFSFLYVYERFVCFPSLTLYAFVWLTCKQKYNNIFICFMVFPFFYVFLVMCYRSADTPAIYVTKSSKQKNISPLPCKSTPTKSLSYFLFCKFLIFNLVC